MSKNAHISVSGCFFTPSFLHMDAYPTSFSSYLAISPSLWWNDCELLKVVEKKSVPRESSVFLAVGEQEVIILGDAKEFYNKLQRSIERVEFYVGPEENHASIVPHSISRAFRFSSK